MGSLTNISRLSEAEQSLDSFKKHASYTSS